MIWNEWTEVRIAQGALAKYSILDGFGIDNSFGDADLSNKYKKPIKEGKSDVKRRRLYINAKIIELVLM